MTSDGHTIASRLRAHNTRQAAALAAAQTARSHTLGRDDKPAMPDARNRVTRDRDANNPYHRIAQES